MTAESPRGHQSDPPAPPRDAPGRREGPAKIEGGKREAEGAGRRNSGRLTAKGSEAGRPSTAPQLSGLGRHPQNFSRAKQGARAEYRQQKNASRGGLELFFLRDNPASRQGEERQGGHRHAVQAACRRDTGQRSATTDKLTAKDCHKGIASNPRRQDRGTRKNPTTSGILLHGRGAAPQAKDPGGLQQQTPESIRSGFIQQSARTVSEAATQLVHAN